MTVYRYLLLNWFPLLAVDDPTLWIGAETLHSIHRQNLVLRSIYTEYLSSYIRLIIFRKHIFYVCVFNSIFRVLNLFYLIFIFIVATNEVFFLHKSGWLVVVKCWPSWLVFFGGKNKLKANNLLVNIQRAFKFNYKYCYVNILFCYWQ